MTTEQRLQRIKAKCQELLAHAEDAAFIAACAGSAEAGWSSTLAAIEAIKNAASIYGRLSCAENELQNAIIAAWPEELL